MSQVKPALNTLRELDGGEFLDKLAIAIHDAASAVIALNRPAKIVVTFEFAALSKQQITEPVITVEADMVVKLPKEGHRSLFYVDEEGNPTTQQQRQTGLDLSIAPRQPEQPQKGAAV